MTRVINYAALQADNVIVGRVLGLDALGTYSRAYQLVQMPGTYIGQALDRVIFPAMSVIQDERERLGRAALHSVALATIIVAPISAALVVFSPLVVVFVLGSQWAASAPVMQVLAIGMTFRMTYKVFDNVAKALGVLRQRVRRESAYLFFVVTFAAFGAQYGVLGVALGVVGAMAINAILAVADLARSIGLTGRMVLAAAAPGLLLSLVGMMLGVSLLSIFGRGPLSAAFAALSLSAFFFGSTALLAVGAGRFPSAAGAALNYVTRRSRG
jgi:PST family polysaccharide transporter